MTPTEYADKLRLQLEELKRVNRPLVISATTVTSEMASRIFVRGEATTGRIGNYDNEKIMYLNPNDADVFGRSLIGKPGKFKNGKDRKTVKLTYKGYKSALGRPEGGAFVSLELTGDLKSDFTNNVPIGSQDILRKVNVNEYVAELDDTNVKKAEGNEKRFGKPIFKLSPTERKLFFDVAEFELRRMFA